MEGFISSLGWDISSPLWDGRFHFLSACTVRQGWGPGEAGLELPVPHSQWEHSRQLPRDVRRSLWCLGSYNHPQKERELSFPQHWLFRENFYQMLKSRALLSLMGSLGVTTQPQRSALGQTLPSASLFSSPWHGWPGTEQVGMDFPEEALRAVIRDVRDSKQIRVMVGNKCN